MPCLVCETILNSEASACIFRDASLYGPDYMPYTNRADRTANGAAVPVTGTGAVTPPCALTMRDCLHVPEVTKNLISVAHLAATAGVTTRSDAAEAVLHIPGGSGDRFFITKRVHNLYVFDCIDVYEAGALGVAVEITLAAGGVQALATIDALAII